MLLANSDTIVHGSIYLSNRLHYIELNPQSLSPVSRPGPVTHASNSDYFMTNKRNLVQYLHRAAFSPVFSIWTKGIDTG